MAHQALREQAGLSTDQAGPSTRPDVPQQTVQPKRREIQENAKPPHQQNAIQDSPETSHHNLNTCPKKQRSHKRNKCQQAKTPTTTM